MARLPRSALLAAFAVAFVASLDPTHSVEAMEKINVGLPVSNYGPMAPVFAAAELGLYKKNGVEAEIINFSGGTPAQEALVAGAVDIIATSPLIAALGVKKGIKQFVVAAETSAQTGWHIMVLTQSPIQSVKDLDGKSVGITATGSFTDYYLLYAAKQAAVHVNRVGVGGGGLIPSLKAKQVDAAVMYSPLPFQLMVAGEGRSIFDIGKEVGQSSPEAWVATQSFVEAHPRAIESFLRSIYQALDHMKKDRDFGVAYLKTYTGDADDRIVNAEYDQVLMEMPTSARIERKAIESSLGLAKLGGISDLPPVEQFYTDRFAAVSAESPDNRR